MSTRECASSSMKEILQKTLTVSRGLDALHREHEAFITKLSKSEPVDFIKASDLTQPEVHVLEADNRFKANFQEQKLQSLNQSLSTVQKGVEETEFMLMVANYISELEGEKLKLRAQVKRLCAENNWLRESLTESQQLLQEAEVSLGRLKVDKEHLEFLHYQRDMPSKVSSPHHGDLQVQELTNGKEGIPVNFPMGLPDNLPHELNSLDMNLDYETPEKIRRLHQLALQLVDQGKPEVAIPLCRKAVQELEQKSGRNSPDLATLLNILAVIYREQGRFKEAIRVLQETLEIRETVFGTTHAIVASTLNNLSVLHGKCGDFKTAEPFCQRALEIRQALLGPDHPDVAKQFCNLAVLSSSLGRYDEVEHYYLRALEIFQLELGPDDPNVTKTMNNLANCYLKQGKYKAAEAMFKKVLKTVHSERSSRQDCRQPTGEAENVSPQPTQTQLGEPGYWHKITPIQSPTITDTLRCLTDTYRGQGRLEDAAEVEMLSKEKNFDQAHKDRIKQLLRDEKLSEKNLTEKLLAKRSNSPISSKTQGLPKTESSKASLTWKWVVGQRNSQHKYSNPNVSSGNRHSPKQ